MKTIKSEIKDQFTDRWQKFDVAANWVAHEKLLDAHFEMADPKPSDTILEACCGTGQVGKKLAQSNAKVFGFDLSLSMLKKARERLFACANGDAESFPFSDNKFEIVIGRQAFHFLKLDNVVKEMARVVKKNGRVVISQIVPFDKKGSVCSECLEKMHRRKQPQLIYFHHEEDLINALKKAGLKDIKVREILIDEEINTWLTDTSFSPQDIKEIKELIVNAPEEYKKLHNVRVSETEIWDTMRFVIVSGIK